MLIFLTVNKCAPEVRMGLHECCLWCWRLSQRPWVCYSNTLPLRLHDGSLNAGASKQKTVESHKNFPFSQEHGSLPCSKRHGIKEGPAR